MEPVAAVLGFAVTFFYTHFAVCISFAAGAKDFVVVEEVVLKHNRTRTPILHAGLRWWIYRNDGWMYFRLEFGVVLQISNFK
jgi:hypothetical protein